MPAARAPLSARVRSVWRNMQGQRDKQVYPYVQAGSLAIRTAGQRLRLAHLHEDLMHFWARICGTSASSSAPLFKGRHPCQISALVWRPTNRGASKGMMLLILLTGRTSDYVIRMGLATSATGLATWTCDTRDMDLRHGLATCELLKSGPPHGQRPSDSLNPSAEANSWPSRTAHSR